MQGIEAVLLRMDQINTQLRYAALRRDPSRSGLIVSLRHDFTEECGNFIKELTASSNIASDPRLLFELQERLDAMRRSLATHQSKWQASEIERDPAGYSQAKDRIHAMVGQFIIDCLQMLARQHVREHQRSTEAAQAYSLQA